MQRVQRTGGKRNQRGKMISELQDMINVADETDNKKAKEILLKIAMLKEENQKSALELVKLILEAKK